MEGRKNESRYQISIIARFKQDWAKNKLLASTYASVPTFMGSVHMRSKRFTLVRQNHARHLESIINIELHTRFVEAVADLSSET